MAYTMQPTRRPWAGWTWAGWQSVEAGERGARRGARARMRLEGVRDRRRGELRYDWRLRQDIPPNAFYAPNQIRHLIRWEAAIGVPTLPPTWIRDPGRPWRLNEITQVRPEPRPTIPPITRPALPQGPPTWWEGAARGLPLGAALLAALLLLVRAADKCLHTNLFKLPLRRRQSEEWPTPSVLATNLSVRMTSEGGAGAGSAPDPPPPYAAAVAEPKAVEEPPPPYSACYVTYSNPPDRPPSVHVYTPRHTSLCYGYEEGRSGLLDDVDTDTGQTNTQDDLASGDNNMENDAQLRVEDGHVVQRIDAPDHNFNQNEDIPAVHSVNTTRDGAVSCEPNIDIKIDSVVVIKNQRDRFLAV